ACPASRLGESRRGRSSPRRDSMSFKSMDLMIDVLPTGRFNALQQPPGLGLCTIGTAPTTGEDDEDDEKKDDDLECAQGTATNDPEAVSRPGLNRWLVRRPPLEGVAASAGA